MSFTPTDGQIIAGTKITDNLFMGRVKNAQLMMLAPNPLDLDDERRVAVNNEFEKLQEVRRETQRLFEGKKKQNVGSYSDYLLRMLQDPAQGITPVIILYSPEALPCEDPGSGAQAAIMVPWGRQLTAIDGDTQLAARHLAAKRNPSLNETFVPIMICHGRGLQWAKQAFFDLNVLGVRPSTAISIGMDTRDSLTAMCRVVEENVPFFRGRINKVRRQLRSSDRELITITTLRGAIVCFAKGINGVQYGSRPIPMKSNEFERIRPLAVEWFHALTTALGPILDNRIINLANTPAVFAALGAIGHEILKVEPHEQQSVQAALLESLRAVRWQRGQAWEGIAGKYTPKGNFSIGGAKENAYAVYAALTDSTSQGYARIRAGAAA